MIVRCTNCNSAFAVKDEKVANKKFAFNCPKCSAENIIDNKESDLEERGQQTFTGKEDRKSSKASVGIATREKDDFGALPEFDEEIPKKAPAKKSAPEEDFDLGDFDLGEEKPSKKESGKRIVEEEEDILLDELAEPTKKADQDDLNLDLEMDENIALEDTGAAKKSAKSTDDFDIDIADELVVDDTALSEDALSDKKAGAKKSASIDIGSEINGLDELGDIPVYDQKQDIISKEGKQAKTAEEDLLADFEPLELDTGKPSPKEIPAKIADELDEFLTETSTEEKIKTEKVYSRNKEEDEDESITIDLDSLEIDLDEGEEAAGKKGKQARKAQPSESEDDITLDLDTLDIDLAEGETISEGEKPADMDSMDFFEEPVKPAARSASKEKDDEDITLDLDTLDIQLDETSEIKKGEVPDDDEKITLEDAGLTIEELTSDELSSVTATKPGADEEEDIKLSIDDIDPSLSIDNIETKLKEADEILSEDNLTDRMDLLDADEDIPDIDFDSFEKKAPATVAKKGRTDLLEEDLIDIESEPETVSSGVKPRSKASDTVPGGSVSLSADYSIRYSRTGALLRLSQLFLVGMIPHFIVLLLYTILSVILGFINHLVVLSTRQAVEDFSEIQENTIRYFLSITASMIGFIEDAPIFAGRESIDYALQMNVTSPYRRSRFLSLLRLSVVGIIAASLPHLLVLGILAVVIPMIFLIGIFSTLFTGRWPFFLFDFLTRYYRYMARVLAYIAGLVDRYPTFKFD